jgi:Protein of unknown function (DUF1573)
VTPEIRNQGKNSRLSTIGFALVLVVLLCEFAYLANGAAWHDQSVTHWLGISQPLGEQSIVFTPSSVAINRVDVGATVTRNVTISNCSDRRITGLAAHSDCSCLQPRGMPTVLEPNESKTLSCVLNVPSTPGRIRRRIAISSSQEPDVTWTVPITGEAVAQIWSSPRSISMTLDQGLGCDYLRIQFIDEFKPAAIICDDTRLAVREIARNSESVDVELSVVSDNAGVAVLKVVREGGEVLCKVPVQWSIRPDAVIVPDTIYLPAQKPPAHLDVFITLAESQESTDLVLHAIVPWITNVTRYRIDERRMRARLELDQAGIPEMFDGAVLTVELGRPEQPLIVRAVRGTF